MYTMDDNLKVLRCFTSPDLQDPTNPSGPATRVHAKLLLQVARRRRQRLTELVLGER